MTNGQYRQTGNQGHTKHKTKINKAKYNTIYVGHNYTQTNKHTIHVICCGQYSYTCVYAYIWKWKIVLPNNVIISKSSKVFLSPSGVSGLADFGYPVKALWSYWSQNIKLPGFPTCRFWAYLLNFFPDTRRAHSIWYLRFYFKLLNIEGKIMDHGSRWLMLYIG